MPRKKPKGMTQRGRHKKRHSGETKIWDHEHLVPKRPSWMSLDTYQKLRELREP